jgi:flagellar motor switch protein FliM
MKNVLSQEEIDALIGALAAGDLEEENQVEDSGMEIIKSKPYDFRKPNKLSKDQIQTIKGIYENYARMLSNNLTGQVRNTVKFTVLSIEQATFSEFIRSVNNPTVLGLFTLEPLEGVSAVEMAPSFCLDMVDLLCGGSMIHSSHPREFTEIEMGMLRDILHTMIDNIRAVWTDMIETYPKLEGVETNPLMVQSMSYNEPVVVISYKVQIIEEHTFSNMCVPYRTFEKVAEQLHAKNFDGTRSKKFSSLYTEDIEKILNATRVDVNVLLGRTDISVEDFMNLAEGDIIQLDSKITEPLKMYVENKEKMYVQPGLFEDKMAVQVIGEIRKEAEVDE